MELRDSRRLTGPNLIWDRMGAVIEVGLDPCEAERMIELWQGHAHSILSAVGWGLQQTSVRTFPGGAFMAMSAPADSLYAACEVNEWAWKTAVAEFNDDDSMAIGKGAHHLMEEIEKESSAELLALQDHAMSKNLSFLADDELVTIGLGIGSRSWPVDELPTPDSIDWSELHDIPIVLVTGTNGKSTTVRLLAEMARHAGMTAGLSSTDWVRVGGSILDTGDYSGPEGARRALRDRRTEVAFLETARGGLLRRGLSVPRASAAIVLNVDDDHLGEAGVHDLRTLAQTKLLVSRALSDGPLILNADDPELRALAQSGHLDTTRKLPAISWFGLDPRQEQLRAFLDGDELVVREGGQEKTVCKLSEAAITLDGAARYNISNCLAAISAALAIKLPIEAIAAGLQTFESTPEDNPGRGNLFELGGVTAFADFAHNPHGMRALMEMASSLPAKRRLVLLGQAGDRTDDSVRQMVQIVWGTRPDRIIVKEMDRYLRGREKGAMATLIEQQLEIAGAPPEIYSRCESEIEAVKEALSWAQPGDLLLLLLHAEREATLELLADLSHRDWKPGEPITSSS